MAERKSPDYLDGFKDGWSSGRLDGILETQRKFIEGALKSQGYRINAEERALLESPDYEQIRQWLHRTAMKSVPPELADQLPIQCRPDSKRATRKR